MPPAASDQAAVPTAAVDGSGGPSLWSLSTAVTNTSFTVQGLGTLPSLAVRRHWALGQGEPMIVDVAAGLAVSLAGERGYRVVRLKDDAPPVEVGVAPPDGGFAAYLGGRGRRVVTMGSSGWAGDGTFSSKPARIYDIDDPARPREVGDFALEADSQTVQPWGDSMLVGEGRFDPTPLAGSLRVIQLVGLEAGKVVGRLDGATWQIAVDGDRAYVVRSCGGRVQPTASPIAFPGDDMPLRPPMESDPAYPDCLAVVDLRDPSHLDLIAELELPERMYPFSLAAHQGFVYMATVREGIVIADARGSGPPTLLNARITKGMKDPMVIDSGGFLGLAVHGSVLYFGNHTTIAAFDLATPTSPTPVAAIELGGDDFIDRMILSDNRLYVSTGDTWGGQAFELWVIEAPGNASDLVDGA